ncbi:plasmid pRiA4b ORF-3 family protein [Saccharococcus sp. Marseille-Q5394]|uniref:plasmid pRiA4b ORF-3 family protein n=1 Tax=Saccharococcus sp. Marseille-Q5394 TaxID=2972778 RepID=UPI0021CAD82F|nr:plasmid pRiA4b ORF-3 family protein [Saccharococcus sp. Marseille-Q5394]
MKIHGTKKLLDAITFEVTVDSTNEEENELYAWHANLLTIDRRKTLVLMNNSSRYVVVLHGLKAKEFKNLDQVIQEAIRKTFRAERIREEVIDRYLKEAGPVSFHKTKNRSFVAQLNKTCDNIWFGSRDLDPDSLINTEVAKRASRWLVGVGKKEMVRPYEELRKDLTAMAGEAIFTTNAAVMKISMPFEGLSIWRRVLVPLELPLTGFHDMLQILFGWTNSHLHEFYVFDQTEAVEPYPHFSPYHVTGDYKPVLNIVMDEELMSHPKEVDRVLEENIMLSDVVPKYTVMKYIYDFGDNWQHEIIVENIVNDGPVESPVCLDGEGDAPPEDCGGEPGFQEFLDVMGEPSHPEHASMKEWAAGQLYRGFDKGLVNHRLRGI